MNTTGLLNYMLGFISSRGLKELVGETNEN
jgi:hypothetical protein